MPEQEINPAAAKFISSLVKSLQILCNGQVDFDESIELVGHINVRVDRKYKFDYIVDEHVSKEGEDSSTTFLSNSYHSRPPLKQLNKKPSASELEQEIMFSEIPHNTNRRLRQSKNSNNSVETHQQEESSAGADENNQNYSVSVEPMDRHGDQPNQMVVKLEEADDSNDCMVLPASPGDYEQVEGSEAFPIAGPSASYDESISVHTRRTRKRRKVNDLGAEENSDGMIGSPHSDSVFSKAAYSPRTAAVVFGCTSCPQMFTAEQDYQTHAPFCVRPSMTFFCSLCHLISHSLHEVEMHIRLKHLSSAQHEMSCDKCSAVFKTYTGLKKHIEVKHASNPTLKCHICGKSMYNKMNLEGHINQHNGVKPHVCLYCGKTFSYRQSLCAHDKLCPLKPR